jgi:hypothetical protein
MPPVVQLLIGLAVLAVLFFLGRRLILHLAERELRAPLGANLDWLIGQVRCYDTVPLQDLYITHAGAHPGVDDPNDVSTHYEVYPRGSHRFSFSRIGHGEKAWYRIDRWCKPLDAPNFPPWGTGACRSSWFVERMETLCNLLDRYPRERTQSSRAQCVMDGNPDPFPHTPA